MRLLQAIILFVFLGAVLGFAVQNTKPLTVWFFNMSVTAPFAMLALGIYVLGMLSGWTVVAFLRRSIQQVTKHRD